MHIDFKRGRNRNILIIEDLFLRVLDLFLRADILAALNHQLITVSNGKKNFNDFFDLHIILGCNLFLNIYIYISDSA